MECSDFDAVLLLSFGGPEGPEQVRPFLENVTRGRNIPPERLDDVAEHYLHFGGVSPINGINRALIEELRAELGRRASTCRSTSATATGSPTSRTPSPRCGTTASSGRRCSPRRRGAGIRVARSTSRTSRGAAPPQGRTRRSWSSCGSTSTIRSSSRCSPTASRSPTATLPDGTARRRPAGVHRPFDSDRRPTSGTGRGSTAARWPTRRGWWRRLRDTTTTTRCGSRAPVHRRYRGWNPMSATTFRRSPRRAPAR